MIQKRMHSIAILVALGSANATASFAADPTYSEAQAEAGKSAYETHCASCHGGSLKGTHLSPSLVGERFDQTWRGKSAEVLAYHVRRMPPPSSAAPGTVTDSDYTNITAYLLSRNGFAAGDALPSMVADLKRLKLPRLEGMDYDPDAPVEPSRRQKILLSKLTPVTSEMLSDPPPGDWLTWGRGTSGLSASPLSAITTENVQRLQPAWRAALRSGPSMSVPLVHDGIVFVHSFPDTVLAIDGTNGQVLWRYQHQGKTGANQKMGLGLAGNKVLVPTSDLQVVALDMKTGEKLWQAPVTTEGETNFAPGGHSLRSAPLVAGKNVIQGVTASFASRGGFIVAFDLESGEEAWRFNSIARPGEPGGETWNDVPMDKRSGGSVWHQGTYDAELGLVYYGIAPTYDTGPLLHKIDKEGVSNEALYTNCTVALDAETGKLVWHYQHMANDQWDLDWAFERQITELEVNGTKRKVVINVGKMAIVEVLDAKTGEYLFSVDTGTQNVITAIDPATGAKTIDPEKMPDPSRETVVCPNAAGARSWPPTSLHPGTNLLYVPITEWCMKMGPQGARLLTSGVGILSAPHPDVEDGKMARLQALDVQFKEVAWEHHQVAPFSTSMLATDGGLLFAGDVEPSLKAFDARTGEVLWRAQLDAAPSSSVISYSVGEQQYVAVLVGINNIHVGTEEGAYRAFLAQQGSAAKAGSDQPAPPRGGATLWAFALGEPTATGAAKEEP